jgi:transposase InsO family protein
VLFRSKDWQSALVFVKPETVIRWHRKGWKYYWRRKSKPKKLGRPPISFKLIHLIRRLSIQNPLWDAPHIHDELALLGHDVAESTVAKYMVHTPSPEKQQSWRTFLKNHLGVTAACDSFTVPTLTFKTLYCFVILAHDRRRIVHVGVTQHPTEEWAVRQVLEAFPGDRSEPRYLIRDRDSTYGSSFRRQVDAMGIEQVVSGRKCPWQNPYCERVIGSIRRECTDHVIPLGERHLQRILNEYVTYYNEARTHLSLNGNSPLERVIEITGRVASKPVLGGLHHRYRRVA